MPKITVHSNNKIQSTSYNEGDNLLQIIRQNEQDITAPCGGNGTCGKCRVKVKGLGIVTACTHYPINDLEVYMPNESENKILTAQHEYTFKQTPVPPELANEVDYPLGLAIDIGTTTVVFYWINYIDQSLIKTRGIKNPQSAYGADVISRINFSNSENGLVELQNSMLNCIQQEINYTCNEIGVNSDRLVQISVSGNTSMLHLLLGVSPSSIALAPYTPQFTEAKKVTSSELGLKTNPQTQVHLLPSISGYVGSDIVSGLASIEAPEQIKNYLFVDIGTNGEMALVTPEKIYCCSTAAGPAFEGANISHGMAALDGAISSYNKGEYQTISDESPIGICGSGLLDIMAYLVENETVSTDGFLEENYNIATNKIDGSSICISPQDVREIQLAKSAILSGINILVQSAGLSMNTIDALFLAGGFGNYLNPESATRISLLPPSLLDKTIPIGNTSGTGAILHVKSELFNSRLNQVVDRCEYIELSTHEGFDLEFAMNMFF